MHGMANAGLRRGFIGVGLAAGLVLATGLPQPVQAWNSADGSVDIHGFADSTTHKRAHGGGLSKQRLRGQLELSKYFQPTGFFSEISIHSTLRATYDAAYDISDRQYGDEAGLKVAGESTGVPTPGGPLKSPWGFSPVTAGNPGLPGFGGFGFDLTANPNVGLKRVGEELGHRSNDGLFGGGLETFAPQRPCNIDPRGCIDGYLDYTEDDLKMPEFRDDHRWLRELYIDATIPFANGDELNLRIGRQQIVWGRTDLFRVLDQVNPIDFSIQNIYEELEDSRIPQGLISAEYRWGATNMFDDINIQFIWSFEEFQPNILGQGGSTYSILGAGDTFRALSNCWHNGCTVSNFATGLSPFGNLATDFPPHVLGIREAHVPDEREEFGVRLEGVFKSVGFSVNYRHFFSQLPSLRAGIPGVNPFVGDPANIPACPPPTPATGLCGVPFNPFDPSDAFGVERPRPFVPAFDIHFPKVDLVGGSADFYVDKVKSAFRVELAWTTGEEFADTSKVRLFSESDVIRWVVGWDRPTYIRFLNPNRTFLLSAQIFGQHLLDHESFNPLLGPPGSGVFGPKIGFQDFSEEFIGTFLFQGNYMNDRLTPSIITAYSVRSGAGVVGPSLNWLPSDNWRLTIGANIKFGTARHQVDDGRTSNSFPPFTVPLGTCGPPPAPNPMACFPGNESASAGVRRGFNPLGAFRSGPIGQAQFEDELQLLVRYRF